MHCHPNAVVLLSNVDILVTQANFDDDGDSLETVPYGPGSEDEVESVPGTPDAPANGNTPASPPALVCNIASLPDFSFIGELVL